MSPACALEGVELGSVDRAPFDGGEKPGVTSDDGIASTPTRTVRIA